MKLGLIHLLLFHLMIGKSDSGSRLMRGGYRPPSSLGGGTIWCKITAVIHQPKKEKTKLKNIKTSKLGNFQFQPDWALINFVDFHVKNSKNCSVCNNSCLKFCWIFSLTPPSPNLSTRELALASP